MTETDDAERQQADEQLIGLHQELRIHDQKAETFARADQFRGDDTHERETERNAHAGQYLRHRRRQDDAQEKLPPGGAETLRGLKSWLPACTTRRPRC